MNKAFLCICIIATSTGRNHRPEAGTTKGFAEMIGMVLVTHGRLAEELIAALEHVVGPQVNISAVCIGPDDDMEQRRAQILDSVAQAEEGNGVILLTDMFGGTPSNLAISIMDQGRGENIAGANLPLVVKLASGGETERPQGAVPSPQETGPQDNHRPGPAA